VIQDSGQVLFAQAQILGLVVCSDAKKSRTNIRIMSVILYYCVFQRCDVMYSCRFLAAFRRNALPPSLVLQARSCRTCVSAYKPTRLCSRQDQHRQFISLSPTPHQYLDVANWISGQSRSAVSCRRLSPTGGDWFSSHPPRDDHCCGAAVTHKTDILIKGLCRSEVAGKDVMRSVFPTPLASGSPGRGR
jgi:hypothetical protein